MIDTTLEDIVTRLNKLEATVFAPTFQTPVASKQLTLPELVKNNALKNGQEKVTAIVGYYERMLGKEAVSPDDIRTGWRQARFNGAYAPILLSRAEANGLVSNYGRKGSYVLTQSGESFYQAFVQ